MLEHMQHRYAQHVFRMHWSFGAEPSVTAMDFGIISTAPRRSSIRIAISRKVILVLECLLLAGCGGAFGVGNTTNPGSTPNISAQTSFRVVGQIGTPFVATVSDARSSWLIYGVIPLSIVIVNDSPPDRIVVTKLSNDTRLLSLQIIHGLDVKLLASTVDNFGVAVGGINGNLPALAPPASPDIRFFIKGPPVNIFDALIEDQTQGSVLQSRAPAVILFDSPSSQRVDGIFNEVNFLGPFDIDLIVDGNIVKQAQGGIKATLKFP
jgi:hypothetical protein